MKNPERTLSGVRAILSAAHVGPEGTIHGHTWEIVAWFLASETDARDLLSLLDAKVGAIDHTMLPHDLSRGEDIARWVGSSLPGCVQVDVSRSAERIFAKWIAG